MQLSQEFLMCYHYKSTCTCAYIYVDRLMIFDFSLWIVFFIFSENFTHGSKREIFMQCIVYRLDTIFLDYILSLNTIRNYICIYYYQNNFLLMLYL